LVACSGNSATGSAAPAPDASHGSTEDAPSGSDDGGARGGDDAALDVDCGHPPRLLDAASAGLHCPNVTDAGKPGTCAVGEHCCEQSSTAGVPSTCAASCDGADAEADWACQDRSQCAGSVCCGRGVFRDEPACGFGVVHVFTGTHCSPACAAGELTVCEQSSECPAGQTCRPAKARGGEMGVCQ
jgi:hypothetical protein